VPQPPPRDEHGSVRPHDHPEILAAHRVIRRISDKQIVKDREGHRRISSIAFKPSSGPLGGMSVDIESFIIAAGHNPQTFVTTPVWIGSVFFHVGNLRASALQVGYDPIPSNDCHGEVWGARTRTQWRWLQEQASWYVQIPGVETAPI
jgi:hypothetical protein